MEINKEKRKQQIKKHKKTLKTLPWGWIFLLLIPVYAVVYYTMAEYYIDFGVMGYSFWSCLYLSITTVTTLGLGDITPVTGAAAAMTASECVLGVMTAGLFLNSIAFKKSEAASEEKEHEDDIEKYNYECKKMLQFCKVIDVTLKHYETSMLYLFDENKKSVSDITEDITVADMPHMFDSVFSGSAEQMSYTRVYHFMQLNDDTVAVIRQLIREINMEYWPDFEALCLEFVDHMSDLRVEEFFMKLEESKEFTNKLRNCSDGTTLAEKISCLAADDTNACDGELFTPFIDLRDMVVHAAAFVVNFRKSVNEITNMDPESIVED